MILLIVTAGLALLVCAACVKVSARWSRWEEDNDNQGSV